jgi:hypothetical protein
MKQPTMLAGLFILVAVPLLHDFAQTDATEEEACKLIAQALEAVGKLKPGMRRADLENDFRTDGGITFFHKDEAGLFRHKARYVYRKCPSIKIDVELGTLGENAPVASPSDPIVTLSRPYLEHPHLD